MAREQRRLAAIVAADVVGYSRLMGRDESGTLARLKKNRQERLEPALARNNGRLVKLTGDGALVEFASAVDALRASIEFQQAVAEAETATGDDRLVFRLGLHVGDLIVDGEDIYGDAVNIAARLEAEAPAGGIVLSRAVRDAVAGKLSVTFEDLGALELKNIEKPVRAYRAQWQASDWQRPMTPAIAAALVSAPALDLPDKPSIAVLPFQNMSGDPEQEYFADGMVEDIITGLSINKSLFVIARNSSFAYKGKSPDIRQVGQELGVRYVLEGSVRKAGNRVRITGQLIDTINGAHLWAERFEGNLEDIFDLQDQMASRVIGGIAPWLERAEIERVKKKTGNLQAYDFYLKCRAQWYLGTSEGNRKALEFARKAVAIDPDFALGHAAIALTHLHSHASGWERDYRKDPEEADRAIQQALKLDRNDAYVLTYCGQTLMAFLRRLEEGAPLLDQAVAIDPNLALAWTYRASSRIALDQPDEAIANLERSLRLSPIDLGKFYALGLMARAHNLRGAPQQAVPFAAESLRLRSNFPAILLDAAVAHALTGDADAARKFASLFRQLRPTVTLKNVRSDTGIGHDYLWGRTMPSRGREMYADVLLKAGLPE